MTKIITAINPNPDILNCLESCPCRKLPLIKCIKQYYLAIDSKLNWFEAHQFCRNHGMELVTLSTKEENGAIIQHLIYSGINIGRFWTSGSDLGEEGKYYWMSVGEQFTFTNWDKKQPDNAGGIEHCIELVGPKQQPYSWNDYP